MRRLAAWLFFGAVAVAFAGAFAFAGAVALAGAVAGAVEFAGAVAVAVAFAGAVAFAVEFAGAFAGAFAFAGAVALAGAFAFAGAVALAGAGAVAFAVGFACQKQKGGIAYGLLVLILGLGLITVFAVTSPVLEETRKSLIFALGMLPLLNAVFDYLSYAATISLIKFGARQKNLLSLLVAACDALLAYGLLIGLGSAILLTLGLINALAAEPFLDIAAIVEGLRDPATRGQYTWLYLTLFSTLIPTGVHAVIGILSVTTWLPRCVKRWIAFQIISPRTGSLGTVTGGALAALFGAVACFAVAIPLYLGGGWVIAHFEWIGLSILSHVETIARLFGVL